jgi:hypothetical protein
VGSASQAVGLPEADGSGAGDAANFDAFEALPEGSASALDVPDQAGPEGHFVATGYPLTPPRGVGMGGGTTSGTLVEAPVEIDLLSFADPLGAVSPESAPPWQTEESGRSEGLDSLI